MVQTSSTSVSRGEGMTTVRGMINGDQVLDLTMFHGSGQWHLTQEWSPEGDDYPVTSGLMLDLAAAMHGEEMMLNGSDVSD